MAKNCLALRGLLGEEVRYVVYGSYIRDSETTVLY
jgi:hypothetical protein